MTRRTALLKAFPDLPSMCGASLDDLSKVPGMNRAIAGLVYTHLQDFQKNAEALTRAQGAGTPDLDPVTIEGRAAVGTGR